MPNSHDPLWLDATIETVAGYRRMIDAAIDQLSDEQLFRRPVAEFNSAAILLRHLGGNLQSRWTNFLTTDGEKSDRDRDQEFEDWPGDRQSLLAYFDLGWNRLVQTLQSLNREDVNRTVNIRGESHTVPQAVQRSLTHIAYHVGQLALISRLSIGDSQTWKWLTIAPGKSKTHNQDTWGTSASRSVFGDSE